jgi:hypothetical protein
MKYMMQMNVKGGSYQMEGWAPKDIKEMVEYMDRFNAELQKNGQWVFAEGLAAPEMARMVKADDQGRPVVTDGPFAESKEFIAGFWIVKVKDENEVYELAAKVSICPGPGGKPMNMPVEVRAVGEAPKSE